MAMNVDGLVLATVNSSWKHSLDAEQLALAVTEGQTADYLPQLATFYGEVSPKLVLSFAAAHEIAPKALSATYQQVKQLTGEANPALELLLVALD
jgi:hypothetical protein